jgi:hypothetical protein
VKKETLSISGSLNSSWENDSELVIKGNGLVPFAIRGFDVV